ncbi:MAG: AbrB/MazE/SpoVT family DNA-binding domain-containing protein [Gammaproteobacteria bacterium]|nr:AbrB/MazE/SpoVT family DNA-binding domain-containing protein [Gammaproteobacteria bacterium]
MKAVVAERGQVTIPKSLREKLGIRPGTILDFEVENGRLVARKKALDPVSAVIGCLPQGNTDDLIAELRGER